MSPEVQRIAIAEACEHPPLQIHMGETAEAAFPDYPLTQPAMRLTRSDSPSLIKHRPLDSSCVGIDSEDLGFDGHGFDAELESDMASMSLRDLSLHHPELTFGFSKGSTRPKGYDYTARLPGGWRTANWRHTP